MKKGSKNIVTGKRGELRVIGKLLGQGFTVYTPVVDIEGIDCIIRNDKGRLIEIQIKTITQGTDSFRRFQVKNLRPHKDFFICCYISNDDELWLIPSIVFQRNSFLTNAGTHILSIDSTKNEALTKYKDDNGLKKLKLGDDWTY